jgi:hypothetical protein
MLSNGNFLRDHYRSGGSRLNFWKIQLISLPEMETHAILSAKEAIVGRVLCHSVTPA